MPGQTLPLVLCGQTTIFIVLSRAYTESNNTWQSNSDLDTQYYLPPSKWRKWLMGNKESTFSSYNIISVYIILTQANSSCFILCFSPYFILFYFVDQSTPLRYRLQLPQRDFKKPQQPHLPAILLNIRNYKANLVGQMFLCGCT